MQGILPNMETSVTGSLTGELQVADYCYFPSHPHPEHHISLDTMGMQKCPTVLVILLILFSVVAPGFAELRFYLDADAKDEGVATHNILGADFGPAEFNITGRLIFLEPGQDCDSTLPHSIYNGTIDYSTLGDFVLYWDIVYGCPYQKKALRAQEVGAKALIVHFTEEIQFMTPMLRYSSDFEVAIPSVIVPDPDAANMFNYALDQLLLGQSVTVEINAENVYVTNFFMVIGFTFGAMFSFEALAGWVSLVIAFKFQRTRNEKLSFLLAAIQTTVQTFYNYTDFWQCRNYFPREVNIILWGLCIYLTFVEVYWFFWVWYTVLIRGTVYRNKRQYTRGRTVVIAGTVGHGIAEALRWILLCIGPNYVYPMTAWRATLVPFIFILLAMFAGLVYVTCQLRSRLIASIKDMGSTGNRKTTHSLNKVTRIGFPIIAIILALSWSLIVFIIKPEVFGVVSSTVYTLCYRTAFVYIPVAHLWSTADRWRREISSSQSSARSRNSKTSKVTTGNIFPKTTKSGEYDSGYGRGTSYGSNTDGDTGDEDDGNDIEQQSQPVRPVIATIASPDQDSNSKEATMQN